jgi:hypothetical protein
VLLDVIESVIPQGANEWKTVALKYQELSKEVNLRAGDQIKKYFNKDLCKDGKKPTGKGTPPMLYDRAMDINLKIRNKNKSAIWGLQSDDEDDDGDDDDDDDDDNEHDDDNQLAVDGDDDGNDEDHDCDDDEEEQSRKRKAFDTNKTTAGDRSNKKSKNCKIQNGKHHRRNVGRSIADLVNIAKKNYKRDCNNISTSSSENMMVMMMMQMQQNQQLMMSFLGNRLNGQYPQSEMSFMQVPVIPNQNSFDVAPHTLMCSTDCSSGSSQMSSSGSSVPSEMSSSSFIRLE